MLPDSGPAPGPRLMSSRHRCRPWPWSRRRCSPWPWPCPWSCLGPRVVVVPGPAPGPGLVLVSCPHIVVVVPGPARVVVVFPGPVPGPVPGPGSVLVASLSSSLSLPWSWLGPRVARVTCGPVSVFPRRPRFGPSRRPVPRNGVVVVAERKPTRHLTVDLARCTRTTQIETP
jgi:hypothetical protein